MVSPSATRCRPEAGSGGAPAVAAASTEASLGCLPSATVVDVLTTRDGAGSPPASGPVPGEAWAWSSARSCERLQQCLVVCTCYCLVLVQ